MKKLLITVATVALAASTSFANAKSGAQAAKEAARATKEVVKPTAPRAGVNTGATVSGQSVTSGAASVTGQNNASNDLFNLNAAGNGKAKAKLTAEEISCTGDSVVGKIPGALQAAITAGIDKGIVNKNNSCLGDFAGDVTTTERAAGLIQAAVSALGTDSGATASVNKKANALVNAARDLAKRTGNEVQVTLNTVKKLCQVKDDKGNPTFCVFNASLCDASVLAAAKL